MRKGNTYYACGYRISYGDKQPKHSARASGSTSARTSWSSSLDRFFATRIFGPQRLAVFRSQHKLLARELSHDNGAERQRLRHKVATVNERLERQLATIKAGVDPTLVGRRIRDLKAELEHTEPFSPTSKAKSTSTASWISKRHAHSSNRARSQQPLASADQAAGEIYNAFHLSVELDRNAGQNTTEGAVSSAFSEANGLEGPRGRP